MPAHGAVAAGYLDRLADAFAEELTAERRLRGEHEQVAAGDAEFNPAGPRAKEIPRTPSARTEFDYGAEGDDAVGCESGERQAVVEREARFNFSGQLGLSFGEVGGLLAVSVVFALGPALLADRLVAGQLGGAGLECKGGPEVLENGVADG